MAYLPPNKNISQELQMVGILLYINNTPTKCTQAIDIRLNSFYLVLLV